jgi:uncharacterized membrane protein YphA (DoxX/SURF4 family)
MADRPQRTRPQAIGWLVLPIRVALGAVFVLAGVLKLEDPQDFAFAIKGFKILPDHAVYIAAFVVPAIEVLAGALLIIGLWARAAALTLVLMLLAFTAGQVSIIARNMSVECTCFGDLEWPCSGAIGTCHLIRNGVLTAMGIIAATLGPGPLSFDRQPHK